MFIVFEGIDGTGKGTQISRAVKYLRNLLGEDQVVETKDPGGTKLGTCLRRVMYEEVPTTEMSTGVVDLIFLASHLQNWQTTVRPALSAGKTVVSDRWWYSQEAYMRQRVVQVPIASAYEKCHGDACNLLIFLHGDVKAMVDRARARETETHQSAKAWNDYDTLKEIQDEYVRLFFKQPEWYPICVDGKNPDQVWDSVRHALHFAMERKNLLVGI